MNKIHKFSIAGMCLFSIVTGNVFASNSTVSVGYARGDFQGVVNGAEGFNVKFRHDNANSAWGVIGSFMYLEHTGTNNSIYSKEKYGSVSAGSSFCLNDWLSIYGLLGVGAGSRELTQTGSLRYGLNYGVGIQVNSVSELALDIGYENSRIDSVDVGSWMIGIGYRY
ncbi:MULTISPECIES: Ail/Lom family outer membrane beta-barrel protein [Enterobacter]|nr:MULTISPECIES: Ail/Lom family outer membrane beta-barrel protein [Enterobacter]AYU97766.1 outer membrane protein OmpX [Enterobacter cloacae]MCG7803987.1 Ail/Lom family outer membrane beta-barrel protein [Enterobacter asburiae]UAN34135.1 Ail/Lom family outer membrane beta-barrel protein [Enterobacter sp. JBIWA005]